MDPRRASSSSSRARDRVAHFWITSRSEIIGRSARPNRTDRIASTLTRQKVPVGIWTTTRMAAGSNSPAAPYEFYERAKNPCIKYELSLPVHKFRWPGPRLQFPYGNPRFRMLMFMFMFDKPPQGNSSDERRRRALARYITIFPFEFLIPGIPQKKKKCCSMDATISSRPTRPKLIMNFSLFRRKGISTLLTRRVSFIVH